MEEDQRRWDERYRDRALASAAEPEALLEQPGLAAALPTAGLAVDVACGNGPQALWLADRGFDVIALDVSPVAIELLERAAHEAGVNARIDARVYDLDLGLPPDVVDVDVLVCQRFRGLDLYGQIVRSLRPGGLAIVTVLSVVGLDGDPGEFHAPAGELMDAFGGAAVEVLHHVEGNGLASIVFRRMAASPT